VLSAIVSNWPSRHFGKDAEIGRYRGTADIAAERRPQCRRFHLAADRVNPLAQQRHR
jgi:hypothetical protein